MTGYIPFFLKKITLIIKSITTLLFQNKIKLNNIFDNKQLDDKQFLISDLKCLFYFKTDSFKLYT